MGGREGGAQGQQGLGLLWVDDGRGDDVNDDDGNCSCVEGSKSLATEQELFMFGRDCVLNSLFLQLYLVVELVARNVINRR